MGPKEILPLLDRVDFDVMTKKGYFTLARAPEVEPHLQVQFSDIPMFCTCKWSWFCAEDTVDVFLAASCGEGTILKKINIIVHRLFPIW